MHSLMIHFDECPEVSTRINGAHPGDEALTLEISGAGVSGIFFTPKAHGLALAEALEREAARLREHVRKLEAAQAYAEALK